MRAARSVRCAVQSAAPCMRGPLNTTLPAMASPLARPLNAWRTVLPLISPSTVKLRRSPCRCRSRTGRTSAPIRSVASSCWNRCVARSSYSSAWPPISSFQRQRPPTSAGTIHRWIVLSPPDPENESPGGNKRSVARGSGEAGATRGQSPDPYGGYGGTAVNPISPGPLPYTANQPPAGTTQPPIYGAPPSGTIYPPNYTPPPASGSFASLLCQMPFRGGAQIAMALSLANWRKKSAAFLKPRR